MSIISIQTPRGQIGILVYLHRNEKATGIDIKSDSYVHPRTASLALANLIELKLVRELKNDTYKLTKKGKRIVEHLVQIESLMSK